MHNQHVFLPLKNESRRTQRFHKGGGGREAFVFKVDVGSGLNYAKVYSNDLFFED